MTNLLALTASLLIAGTVSALAAENSPATTTSPPTTHSTESMMAGSHMMPGQKQMHMSDRAMPSHSRHCTEEALAKMPPEHRAACHK